MYSQFSNTRVSVSKSHHDRYKHTHNLDSRLNVSNSSYKTELPSSSHHDNSSVYRTNSSRTAPTHTSGSDLHPAPSPTNSQKTNLSYSIASPNVILRRALIEVLDSRDQNAVACSY